VARISADGATLRIGRGPDNDIVLADGRVSRRHGQISVRLGTLIYSDLDSTNGSYLQGSRIQEIALGPHDVIQLGGSTLTIEPAQ
jgi:pSer/pThr/pTyr-binding forkhead associated (FHA) protein